MGRRIDMARKASSNFLAVWNPTGSDNLVEAEVIFCGDKEAVINAIIDFLQEHEHAEGDIDSCLKVFKVGTQEKLEVEVVTDPQYTVNF